MLGEDILQPNEPDAGWETTVKNRTLTLILLRNRIYPLHFLIRTNENLLHI